MGALPRPISIGLLHCLAMALMILKNRQELINAIAGREGSARELAERFDCTTKELAKFLNNNREAIEIRASQLAEHTEEVTPVNVVTPTQLDELWITQKFERLIRLQSVAEMAYKDVMTGNLTGAELATQVREFRSYLMLAANELGQLLHRGSGDAGTGDSLNIEISGIDLDTMR